MATSTFCAAELVLSCLGGGHLLGHQAASKGKGKGKGKGTLMVKTVPRRGTRGAQGETTVVAPQHRHICPQQQLHSVASTPNYRHSGLHILYAADASNF